MKKYDIDNRGMDFFDKQIFQNPTELNKLFLQQLGDKSFKWNKLIPEYKRFKDFIMSRKHCLINSKDV